MNESSKDSVSATDSDTGGLADVVGKRVRAIRSRRGLTRKNLAHHSHVSERYLAQLETGSANISLSLLSRIARALDVNVVSFLPAENETRAKHELLYDLIGTLSPDQQEQAYRILKENFSRDRQSARGVAMVGLRGAGKTTLGTALALHNDIPFVRLDETIELLSGMDIGDLISLRGQNVYRRFELQALQQTIAEYPQSIVETGGSLISEKETYRLLRKHYYTVWIRAVPEDHMARVIAQGDLRPISGAGRSQGMEDSRLILEERETDYSLADYTLMTSGRSIEECVAELIRVCTPMFG